MKTGNLLAVALLAATLAGCSRDSSIYDEALKELDYAIAHQEDMYKDKSLKLDSLKNAFSNARNDSTGCAVGKQLYTEYSLIDLDSAIKYAHIREQCASRSGNKDLILDAALDLAERYVVSGAYDAVLDILEPLDTAGISNGQMKKYLSIQERMAHGLFLTNKDPVRKLLHRQREQELTLKIQSNTDNRDNTLAVAYGKIDRGDPDGGLQMICDYLESGKATAGEKGGLHYWIAKAYGVKNDKNNEILHYAISANYDKKAPVKASRSLIRLANLLYKDGDTYRAFKYILSAYEDATQSDARVALEEINEFFPKIIYSFNEMKARRTRLLIILFWVSILFILFLGILMIIINHNRIQIKKMQLEIHRNNEEIAEMNVKLKRRIEQIQESNQIKDAYLGRYVSIFSKHMDSVERYRSKLRVIAKSHDLQEIRTALRSDDSIITEREEFLREFDTTFLSLFPNFVNQLNDLLKEDCRIGKKLKQGKLTDELRIFALIRLGVTDSASIARFLKKSPSTIYNYRVKLRNAAKSEREVFEKQLLEIG